MSFIYFQTLPLVTDISFHGEETTGKEDGSISKEDKTNKEGDNVRTSFDDSGDYLPSDKKDDHKEDGHHEGGQGGGEQGGGSSTPTGGDQGGTTGGPSKPGIGPEKGDPSSATTDKGSGTTTSPLSHSVFTDLSGHRAPGFQGQLSEASFLGLGGDPRLEQLKVNIVLNYYCLIIHNGCPRARDTRP